MKNYNKHRLGIWISIIFFGAIILIQQIQKNKRNQQNSHYQINNSTYEKPEKRPPTGEIDF
jgi:preprotein translocase subunit SecG